MHWIRNVPEQLLRRKKKSKCMKSDRCIKENGDV